MNTNTDPFKNGGCACGAIRFRFDNEPVLQGICHCRTCQKSTASPFFAGLVVAKLDFKLLGGEPKNFASSEQGRRSFCRDCGCQLFFERGDRPDHITILVGALDDARPFQAETHIWDESQISWLKITDSATRFPGARPPNF